MIELKEKDKKERTPAEGERKYGNVEYADEKNKKYPLDTKEHVDAAARYWGEAKNKDEYTSGRATITNRIAAAKNKFNIK